MGIDDNCFLFGFSLLLLLFLFIVLKICFYPMDLTIQPTFTARGRQNSGRHEVTHAVKQLKGMQNDIGVLQAI